MLTNRSWPLAALILIFTTLPSFADDLELSVGKTLEGIVRVGKPGSYGINLNAGDYAQIKIDPRAKLLVVIAYAPSGGKFRGATLGPDEERFNFVADRPGTYRIEVAVAEKGVEASYAITLEKIVTLQARLAPLKPVYESPRIKALRATVEAGKPESTESFWQEIRRQGAPIIEALPGDAKNMLVTFLWKGTPDTHSVIVLYLPYAGAAPDEYFMDRLAQTDVWYTTVAVGRKARFEYSIATNVPRIHPISVVIDGDIIAMIAAAARVDPLNPKRWRVDPHSVDLPEYEGRSIVEMPDAPPQPWVAERPGVPRGQIEKRLFKSALLKNEREIAIYLPAGYSKNEKPYPLLVVFDEIAYLGDKKQVVLVPTPTILDNLISESRIPAMVALLIGNAAGARDRELVCNPVFSEFLSSELLPWAHGLYNFSSDARETVVAGSSAGGLAAACAGLHRPGTFGNILSQSGAFHRRPTNSDGSSSSDTDSEPNWLARQFIASPRLPLRFYLDAGSDEIDVSGGGNSILLTNRTLRDVLRAKGYEVHFQEYEGGHDYLSWRGTLADGLIALMGHAAPNPSPHPQPKP